ncbi:ANTAR domain-containing protein [Actinobacteria bacterium YIM 96077]|uniref:ANTAR domain-containing protein n=2 Tax=Phytoactinopolyspora halophila TaxID=1981511 RepID=A0A329R3D0_9ACTN|nr:ANTAR domain-containing protein [Actinobacteria bacterium YIM 96077]RAW18913.1 hypothetical protein DPM12_02405 [Phytoactinopolyspora halophila]
MARDLTGEAGVNETLSKVIEYAKEFTGSEDGGVALLGAERKLEAARSSDERAGRADTLQDALREGPVVNAARTHKTYLVRDIASDGRWPRWGPLVVDLGLHSVVSTCLYTERHTIGTLNVYSSEPGALSEEDAENIQVFASHAAVAIESAQEGDGLRRAIETRNVIGQAQGLLMERYGLDARRAFDVLRRYSQETNTKLRTVAERLVYERRLPDGE